MSDPRIGHPPDPPCWHKHIDPDGICLDCGKRAAIANLSATRISGPHLTVSMPPPVRSVLYIHNLVKLESPDPPPNSWWRFCHWALLGWRWEKLL
jgi:hypothetical protein